jgi:hypothetical protein
MPERNDILASTGGIVKIAFAVCILAAVSGAVLAAAKPDFTGTWLLDTKMSRFDKEFPAPKRMTLTIEHHEPKLHVEIKSETKQGPQDLEFDLTTDGTEAKDTNAQDTSATAQWADVNATRLMLTIKQQSPHGTVETTRIMNVGSQGKMLTTVLSVQSQGHEEDAYEFFERKQ